MIRTLAILLLIAFAVVGGILIYEGMDGPTEALIVGASVLASSVFALAVLQGQEKNERILNGILRELQTQARQPDEATDRATLDR